MRILIFVLIGLALSLAPVAAEAADGDRGDFLLRVNSDVRIPAGETVGTLVVIKGNATVEGRVRRALVVVQGDAVVSGRVDESVTVIQGDVDLRGSASVGDVVSIQGDVRRASGATVTGTVRENESYRVRFWDGAAFGFYLWLALTIVVIVAGLVFAAIGGRQLGSAARSLTAELPYSILGAVVVWVAVPVLAVLVMFTLVGIPLGIGLLLFLLPALWFLGYIVAGARLGSALLGFAGRPLGDHPYLATFFGLLIFQVLLFLPFLGFVVAWIAALWGAGGLALVAFRAARGSAPPAAPAGPGAVTV